LDLTTSDREEKGILLHSNNRISNDEVVPDEGN
jgi:hypothetical protein